MVWRGETVALLCFSFPTVPSEGSGYQSTHNPPYPSRPHLGRPPVATPMAAAAAAPAHTSLVSTLGNAPINLLSMRESAWRELETIVEEVRGRACSTTAQAPSSVLFIRVAGLACCYACLHATNIRAQRAVGLNAKGVAVLSGRLQLGAGAPDPQPMLSPSESEPPCCLRG